MSLKLKECVVDRKIFENGTILLDLRGSEVEDRRKIFNILFALGFDPNVYFIRITREVTPYVISLIDEHWKFENFYLNTDLLEKEPNTKYIYPKQYLHAISSKAIQEYLDEEIIPLEASKK